MTLTDVAHWAANQDVEKAITVTGPFFPAFGTTTTTPQVPPVT